MATVGVVIAQALTAPAVVAIAGDRVFPNVLIEGVALPAVVYQVVSQIPQSSFDGSFDTRLFQSRVQIDCYARRYLDAQNLAAAVGAAIEALSSSSAAAWMEAQRDLFDNETQYHRVSMDFSVWL